MAARAAGGERGGGVGNSQAKAPLERPPELRGVDDMGRQPGTLNAPCWMVLDD